ncbi:hypothetical protein cyc_06472 [Cyclospora cayetanensis]|uniref:BTB domain-containing protein n=1 Tax=Cyclospora cayetanensis TaxID=88456 RepID=A0A1D3D3G8_9EIME|nr:hypothetical protein cyc_06472 [Cyclospora cayetanensis]
MTGSYGVLKPKIERHRQIKLIDRRILHKQRQICDFIYSGYFVSINLPFQGVKKEKLGASWRIQDFLGVWSLAKRRFLRPRSDDQYVDSHLFGDGHLGRWFLRMYPWGDHKNSGSLELYLMLESSLPHDLLVHYKLQRRRRHRREELQQQTAISRNSEGVGSQRSSSRQGRSTSRTNVSSADDTGAVGSQTAVRSRHTACPRTSNVDQRQQGQHRRHRRQNSSGSSSSENHRRSQRQSQHPSERMSGRRRDREVERDRIIGYEDSDVYSKQEPGVGYGPTHLCDGSVATQVAAFVLSSPPDLILKFGGQQFAANKIALAACSKVFRAMLNGKFKEGTLVASQQQFSEQWQLQQQQPVLELPLTEVTPAALQNLLQCIHTDNCESLSSKHTSMEACLELLVAADLFDVQSIYWRSVEACRRLLSKTNFTAALLTAQRINCTPLMQAGL